MTTISDPTYGTDVAVPNTDTGTPWPTEDDIDAGIATWQHNRDLDGYFDAMAEGRVATDAQYAAYRASLNTEPILEK